MHAHCWGRYVSIGAAALVTILDVVSWPSYDLLSARTSGRRVGEGYAPQRQAIRSAGGFGDPLVGCDTTGSSRTFVVNDRRAGFVVATLAIAGLGAWALLGAQLAGAGPSATVETADDWLLEAAESGNSAAAIAALKHVADVDTRAPDGTTALI